MENSKFLGPCVSAYLAGCVDCDGSIYISMKRSQKHGALFRPSLVVVTNKHRSYVEAIHALSRLANKVHIHQASGLNASPTFVAETGRAELIKKLLHCMIPYLVRKREQAELMLEFLEAKNPRNLDKQAICYAQMRQLNSPIRG